MRISLLWLLPFVAACAGGLPAPVPTLPQPPRAALRGVPGFDTREYPGDATMRTWRDHSPYRWVGYYLESPCRPRSSWMGRRGALEAAGWGTAVLYVGEQQWADTTTARAAAAAMPRCTRANLTAERGAADAVDADTLAAQQGFARNSIIYLNVERVEQVSPALGAYVSAWVAALLERGRFRPGLYAHDRNQAELLALVRSELSRRGVTGASIPLWLARTSGFALEAAPGEAGGGVRIWQGVLNAQETWGGVSLRIDVNVADVASPSAPELR